MLEEQAAAVSARATSSAHPACPRRRRPTQSIVLKAEGFEWSGIMGGQLLE